MRQPADEVALDRLRRMGPVFRSTDAVDAGVSWRDLYALRDRGDVVELSRGLYQLAEASGGGSIEFVAMCGRAPHGMICRNSAMAYWDLSDEIPGRVHVAVARGAHRPTIDHPPTVVHVFQAETFELGRVEQTPDDGARFWSSDPEGTVVDVFQLRHRLGEDLAYDALRRYLQRRRRLPHMAELARALCTRQPLSDAIRVLQS